MGKIWFSPFFDKIKFHLQLKESKENLEYLLLKVIGPHIPILFFFVKSGGLINFQVCVGIIFIYYLRWIKEYCSHGVDNH